MTKAPRNSPHPAETLWTSIPGAAAASIFRRIADTTQEQREELARQAALEAHDSIAALLKPYETEVTRETLLLTLGSPGG